ncbi:MAG: hypothetical protein ACP5RN_12225 [Armatimonadota bacterium]
MMWKRLFGVTLLLVLASNLCWAQYRFNGTFYLLGGVCGAGCTEGTDEPGMGEFVEIQLSVGAGDKQP